MPSSAAVVTVLTVHPDRIAATRLRATQYTAALAEAGITLRVWSFLRAADLDVWFGDSHLRRAGVVCRALLRLPRLRGALRGASVVIVHREALPFGPAVLERLAARGRRLVWDVDDAIWTPFRSPTSGGVPQWVRGTGGKYARLCRRADEVWAGSETLARWCRRHNDRVVVIPTVVQVPTPRPARSEEPAVIWIGTHSTGPFLESVLPTLQEVDPPPPMVIVGARLTSRPPRAEVLDWSPENERHALRRGAVGLYPIDVDHPLADGKCGLKAILYMAHGIPPVVTPTQTNASIVRDGIDGIHATGRAQWRVAVQSLLADPELWERMAQSAYGRALEEYSLQVWAPRIVTRLSKLAGTVAA